MKKVKLIRLNTSKEGTFGKLFLDDQFICATGELPRYAGDENQANERGTDCIPAGTYKCSLRKSPKFGLTYEVKNVPDRKYILIHKGNFCGERPKYRSDVEGCIILGEKTGYLDDQKIVMYSSTAYKRFMELMNNEDFELSIVWA